ncbi:uncharacterized protein VTP21DRAFT_7393 [Calcarisporiella thermophila]|uniref:uncharacterized protein n=1 Tax=Calcarisporiella thermophila TaxID=911321 RepID=UPI0037430D8C
MESQSSLRHKEKKKKSKKEHRKHKKKHRSSKKHKRHDERDTSGSSSESDDGGIQSEAIWVEKPSEFPAIPASNESKENGNLNQEKNRIEGTGSRANNSTLSMARDSWMTDEFDFSNMGQARRQKDQNDKKPDPDKPVISEREINTYYKSGLSVEDYPEEDNRPKYKIGDAGSQWRMMKLRRVLEQAKEEGRSVEEVGLERYGSLERLQEALAEKEELDRRKSSRNKKSSPRLDLSSSSSRSTTVYTDFNKPRESFKRPPERSRNEYVATSRAPASPSSSPFTPHPPKRYRSRSPSPSPARAAMGAPLPSPAPYTATFSAAELAQHPMMSPTIPKRPEMPRIISHEAASTISPTQPSQERVLSLDEMNKLQSRILKAKLIGDMEKVEELEKEYEMEKKRMEEKEAPSSSKSKSQVSVIPTLDSQGRIHEFALSSGSSESNIKNKKKIQTHDAKGERIRYSNEDELSLEDLVRQEKVGVRRDADFDMATRIASDSRFQDDLEYLDENADRLAMRKERNEEKKKLFAIGDYKRTQAILDSCPLCYHEEKEPGRGAIAPKVPIVSLGTKAYLALPNVTPLVDGHCWIVPIQHALTTVELDQDVWDEIRNFKKCLLRMFASEERTAIFMETVVNLRAQRHTVIECVPLPWGLGDDAPAFFKEGIMVVDEEWSQNKKLIDTSKRGFRNSLTRHLPYFHVWFGLDKGFGHVIEDRSSFPDHFGREILGGMLDLPPSLWRRPKRMDSRGGRERVREFMTKWKDYDWTVALEGGEFKES